MTGLPSAVKLFPADIAFIDDCLSVIPKRKHDDLMSQHAAMYPFARRDANLLLLEAKEAQENIVDTCADAVKFPFHDLPEKVKDIGAYHAYECKKILGSDGDAAKLFDYAKQIGIEPPIVNKSAKSESDQNSFESAVKRLLSSAWWQRKIAVKRKRDAELKRIKRGIIGNGKQVYCSDIATEAYIRSQESAKEFMESLEAVSEDGETVDMAEVLKGSRANPAVRRAELMVRMYGFDQYASEHEHVAEFYTITCPSRFHSSSKNYDGSSPRDAQKYLSSLWANIRSKLKRNDLYVYGFRVAEAHKDSCVHWHLLLFMQDGTQEAIRSIIKDYALREDVQELQKKDGSWSTVKDGKGGRKPKWKVRFDHESIKAGLGYATSYLSKYVAKNLDGHEVGIDKETGLESVDTSIRVRAWSSLHGVRQFQQIGGAPVGVWRELRRLKSSDDALIESARIAADGADWKSYLEVQGGALTPRANQLIRTFNETCLDEDTGEIKLSAYGEFITKVKGLETNTGVEQTRLIKWVIQPKSKPASAAKFEATQARSAPWFTCNNYAQDTKPLENQSGKEA